MDYKHRRALVGLVSQLMDAWRSDETGREFARSADAIYALLHRLHHQGHDEECKKLRIALGAVANTAREALLCNARDGVDR